MLSPNRKWWGPAIAVMGLIAAVVVVAVSGVVPLTDGPLPISGLVLVAFAIQADPNVGIPVAIAILIAIYFAWLRPAWRDQAAFTAGTWVLALTLFALSAAWYWTQWHQGVTWQGNGYTVGCAIGAICVACVYGALGLVGATRNRQAIHLAARWLLLVWMVTYGFPYMGELP